LLAANLSPETQIVTIRGYHGSVRLRFLDETNAVQAMTHPDAYRSQVVYRDCVEGQVKLSLLPYAVCRIDGDGTGDNIVNFPPEQSP
jgi:hypothetical protein